MASLFPHDDDIGSEQFDAWMGELTKLRRVVVFEDGGKKFGYVPGFKTHQCISKAERDNDLRARVSGRVSMPVPVTVGITVIGTVPETPDVGRMTHDAGHMKKEDFTSADAPAVVDKKPRKAAESIGPEIATSDGPWRLSLKVGRQRMETYGMSEDQLVAILNKVARYNSELTGTQLPGAAAMQNILHTWFAKHSPGSVATDVAPRLRQRPSAEQIAIALGTKESA
jgi:hypothetical protein